MNLTEARSLATWWQADLDHHGCVRVEIAGSIRRECPAPRDMLADAWNEYMQLPDRASADDSVVTDAIHQAQQAIALRVARRADPGFWRPAGAEEVDRG